jgi:hypothetical protein
MSFNFGLPPGQVFACMAETLVLGLDDAMEGNYSLGKKLETERVRAIGQAAHRHGFEAVAPRSTTDEPVDMGRLVEFLITSGFASNSSEARAKVIKIFPTISD